MGNCTKMLLWVIMSVRGMRARIQKVCAGVIFGNDLKYNPDTGEWEGFPENSHDGKVKGSENFVQLMKNTYRVLLGRGMKACYVYFMDKETLSASREIPKSCVPHTG